MLPSHGACIFAEDPGRAAPEARIIWHADLDPGTLRVAASPCDPANPDAICPADLAPWLSIVLDAEGRERAVLSEGWHHIRIDVEEGSMAAHEAVLLRYRIEGTASAQPQILPLRRFLALWRHRRFSRTLFPREPRVARWVAMLRVHDARASGASHREIATVLFGDERIRNEWNPPSDSLRSRVRRLAREANAMARGGYRHLLRQR